MSLNLFLFAAALKMVFILLKDILKYCADEIKYPLTKEQMVDAAVIL